MNKLLTLIIVGALTSSVYANIPYCPGTDVKGSKHDALQYVVKTFADQNDCKIGNNCLLNFDTVKYSIAWSEPCPKSAAKLNDPNGSTFVCKQGLCVPYGFSYPSAKYDEEGGKKR
jgi:hypothetical protein